MTGSHKEGAIAAILLASVAFCPWNSFLDSKALSVARKFLLATSRGYLLHGCRAAPVVTCALMKEHWLDPLMLPLMKLLKMSALVGPMMLGPLRHAFDTAALPTSLATTLAACLKKLGGQIEGAEWIATTGQRLRLLGPLEPTPKNHQVWLHDCREVIKQAAMTSAVAHRHEFSDIRGAALDFQGSLKLFRSMPPGQTRGALELALAGGMLTHERMFRRKGWPYTKCPFGCETLDADVHRFWYCPRHLHSRAGLTWVTEDLPNVTRCSGWFVQGHPFSQGQIIDLQRHLVRVIRASSKDFRTRDQTQNSETPPEPDPFLDGRWTILDDDHEDGVLLQSMQLDPPCETGATSSGMGVSASVNPSAVATSLRADMRPPR